MVKLFGWTFSLALHAWLLAMVLGLAPKPQGLNASVAAGLGFSEPPPRGSSPAAQALREEPAPWRKRLGSISLTRQDPSAVQARVEAARRAGERSELRRQQAIARLYRDIHGAELAAVMQRPLAEAWRELEDRALRGEAGAADALHDLAGSCLIPLAEAEEGRGRFDPVPVIQRYTAGLEPEAAAYVSGALTTEYAILAETAAVCAAEGLGSERLERLIAARAGPRRPSGTSGNEVPESASASDLHERFEDTFPRVARDIPPWDSPHAGALDRLYLKDEALNPQEWQALLDAAAGDAVVARALGSCLLHSCAGIPALDDAQRELMADRAAALGHPQLLLELAGRRATPEHRVRAYAAAQYLQWLAASGCSAFPLMPEFAGASRALATMQTELPPADRAAGTAQVNRWIAAGGPHALQLLGCD